MSAAPVTVTDLIAAASNVLERGGYHRIRDGFPEWNTTATRLFEDKYNIVGIAAFATASELVVSWTDLQGSLVDAISSRVGRSESKAWDGYLVLLTTAMSPSNDAEIAAIHSDTTRLRKLVATGEFLESAGDVERILRPLLPLRTVPISTHGDGALEMLPAILAQHGVDEKLAKAVIRAFAAQEPLMEEINRRSEP